MEEFVICFWHRVQCLFWYIMVPLYLIHIPTTLYSVYCRIVDCAVLQKYLNWDYGAKKSLVAGLVCDAGAQWRKLSAQVTGTRYSLVTKVSVVDKSHFSGKCTRLRMKKESVHTIQYLRYKAHKSSFSLQSCHTVATNTRCRDKTTNLPRIQHIGSLGEKIVYSKDCLPEFVLHFIGLSNSEPSFRLT